HKRVIVGKREARKDSSGEPLDYSALGLCTHTLDNEAVQAARKADRKLQGHDCPQRHAQNRGRLKAVVVKELLQVIHEVAYPESAPQNEWVFLASQLIRDDTEVN